MRVLQVLRALVLSPVGDNLSDESICEIMLSCFRLCFETRLSELLRRTAEHCLRDMVQHLFIRLPHFADDPRVLPNMKKMRTNGIENTRPKNRKNKNNNNNNPVKVKTKSTSEDIDEQELLSPIPDRLVNNKSHLATTPVTLAGNIVDMQGSLDQGTPDNKNNSIQKNCLQDEDNKKIESNTSDQVVEDDKEMPEGEKSPDLIKSPVGSVEDLSVVVDDDGGGENKIPNITIDENIEEYVNQQGVRFTPLQQLTPYGALCIRELFRFLVSLSCPLDKQNTETMTHLGLSLLQVALEISADAISNFPSLLSLIKDELCRNLILLLNTERLSILAGNLQVSFLLFESQREHLKFQFEQFILKLMEIISSERITYEQRELSLEAITRLWRIPGLPAELYLNYDCGLYSTNLYEELMKLLSKNASALMGVMYSLQFISLDAIMLLITGIESRCRGLNKLSRQSRHSISFNLPTRDELLKIKTKKRLLALGTEKFNENPREGIAKLAEDGLFGPVGTLDPQEIAKLLKENPMFDKKAIGEYISRRDNTPILNCFVQNFDLRNMRVDQALRPFLEAFRLPGEAPLISMVMEKFAEHWYNSNGQPFASEDAAFLLAYGIIMLNVDQHNHNVKRVTNPMTLEQFKKNLLGGNGAEGNFDETMLEEIYSAIKNEEIVMPAEQSGMLKENYLWKVLLKRGSSTDSLYLRVGNDGESVDKEIAEIGWAPIISALCHAYDKAPDRTFQRRVAQSFLNCASICAHYRMNSDLDTLIVALCKFTGLATTSESELELVVRFGGSGRCQLATRTLFQITHQHGNGIRSSWKNITDCIQILYKARLLPKYLTEGDDFLELSGRVSLIREPTIPKQPPQEQGILSSLYSYIALDSTRVPQATEASTRKRATDCISNCLLKQIIEESKFLEVDSLRALIGALVSVDSSRDEDISGFLLEILLEMTIQNRDRVQCIWPIVLAHMDGLLITSLRENQPYLLERVAIGMLRLAIRLLRSEEFASTVLPPLIPLTHLPSATHSPLARQISYGLFELLKTGAANIHTTDDWKVVFSLLECSGAGAVSPKTIATTTTTTNALVLEESNNITKTGTLVLDQRPVSPVPEWVLVSPTGTEAPLPVTADTIVLDRDLLSHDPAALVKSCESLTFLVRDVAHVTPFNFELCIRCIRTFAEAVLQIPGKRNKVTQAAIETPGYQQAPLQLLDLMHTLHTRTGQIFRWWAEENGTTETISLWPHAWRPLLQGIARLCCDSRRPVRAAAITYLQSTLLAHDLTQLTPMEWSQCLEQVLFPLLAQLLGPVSINDPSGVEETRVRAAMLLSKVFLHHLTPLLTLPGFLPLWLTVLDLLKSYMHADNSELLFEAIPESLKNMLLVMASTDVLMSSSNLWEPTWRTINSFLPNLKGELFPEPASVPRVSTSSPVISLVGQEQPSFTGSSIAPQPNVNMSFENNQEIKVEEEEEATPSTETPPAIIEKTNFDVNLNFPIEQHVVNLISQPPPSVSSPVAIQPSSQNFDFYRGNSIDDNGKDEFRGNFEVEKSRVVEEIDVTPINNSHMV